MEYTPYPEEPGTERARRRPGDGTATFGERPLASALHCLDHGLALFDADDHLRVCNAAYRGLFDGPLQASLIGRHHEWLLDAWIAGLQFDSDEERARFRGERLLQRREQRTDFEVCTQAGRSLRVSDRRTPEGNFVTTILDRTEDERRLAEQREARAAAEAASAAKSQFLSSMSHELRTPLNVILGFSQLLQRDVKQPLPERHRARVHQILKGGNHLVRLIDDLLDLSRIEAGRICVSSEPVDVWSVLDQVHAALGPSAASAGVRLEFARTGDATPKITITADQTRFTQILLNFGSNAIKYNRPNGSVHFAVLVTCADSVRVSVRDTGVGIPADQHARLFQPFQRAGQERGPIEGTGLGLVITKRLAELMQGRVGFSSAFAQGSEFWVDMPVFAGGGATAGGA